MGLQIFDGRDPFVQTKHFLLASGTTKSDFVNNGLYHALITNILLSNDDTIAHVVDIWQKVVASYFLIGSVNVPAGTGFAGVPSVDLIATMGLTKTNGLLLYSAQTFALSLEVALVGAHYLDATVLGVFF